jgi:glycosyltransferase involved in cell wall biosynthesis
MKYNVFEIANPGHFTLVDSTIRILTSNPSNAVTLIVSANHLASAKKLDAKLNRKNLSITEHADTTILQKADLSIVITPDQGFRWLLNLCKKGKVAIFIHNTDDWFGLNFLAGLGTVLRTLIFKREINLGLYLLKRLVVENPVKADVIKHLRIEKSPLFVLNNHIKQELARYYPAERIKIIPFSVYDPALIDKSQANEKIRICIPGRISQKRRDYLSVFDALESLGEKAKSELTIDLLGGISKASAEKADVVVQKAKKLIAQGFDLILRDGEYIELEDFDIELSKADIILGNLIINQEGRSKYGNTKESGIPFTMIRAAKPGILPEGYQTIPEIMESTLFFRNYDHLKQLLDGLCKQTINNLTLKEKAKIASLAFLDKQVENNINLWE